MKRWLYVVLVGLLLASIVHILIVLLVPSYAAKDAWAKLGAVGEPWKFSIIVQPGETKSLLPRVDPAFGIAACRYNLDEAPLIVEAEGLLLKNSRSLSWMRFNLHSYEKYSLPELNRVWLFVQIRNEGLY